MSVLRNAPLSITMPTSKSGQNDSINPRNSKLINCNNPNCKASFFEIMPNCPFCGIQRTNTFTSKSIKNLPLSHTTSILNELKISGLFNKFYKWIPISLLAIFTFSIILFYLGHQYYKAFTQPHTTSSVITSNLISTTPAITSNEKIYNCSNLNIHALTNEEICLYYNSNKFPACNPILENQLRLRNLLAEPIDRCGRQVLPEIETNEVIYNCSNLNIYSLTNEEICFYYNSNKFPACNPILKNQLRLRNALVDPVDKCGQLALRIL